MFLNWSSTAALICCFVFVWVFDRGLRAVIDCMVIQGVWVFDLGLRAVSIFQSPLLVEFVGVPSGHLLCFWFVFEAREGVTKSVFAWLSIA